MISAKFQMVSMVIGFSVKHTCLLCGFNLSHFTYSLCFVIGNIGIEERMHLVWDTMVVSYSGLFTNPSLNLYKLMSLFSLSSGIWPNFCYWFCSGDKHGMVCFVLKLRVKQKNAWSHVLQSMWVYLPEVCKTCFDPLKIFPVLRSSIYIQEKEQFFLDLMQISLYSIQTQALKLVQGLTTLDQIQMSMKARKGR